MQPARAQAEGWKRVWRRGPLGYLAQLAWGAGLTPVGLVLGLSAVALPFNPGTARMFKQSWAHGELGVLAGEVLLFVILDLLSGALAFYLCAAGVFMLLDVFGGRELVEGTVERKSQRRRKNGTEHQLTAAGRTFDVPRAAYERVSERDRVRLKVGRFAEELYALWVED